MTPLLILAAWLELSHVGIRLEMLDREAQDKVRNIVANIDSQIDAQIAALEVLASSPLIDDSEHWPDFYTMALSFRAGFGGHVILSDTSMQMLLNTRSKLGSKLPKLPVPKGRAAAPLVLETGKPAVGDSFLGPIAGEQLIAVIVPVIRNDHIRYLLLGTIETRKYQELIDKLVIPPGWAVVLRDGIGKTMAHNTTAGIESTKNKTFYGKHFAAQSRGSGWSITLEIPGLFGAHVDRRRHTVPWSRLGGYRQLPGWEMVQPSSDSLGGGHHGTESAGLASVEDQ
jgi:hypothetical protein